MSACIRLHTLSFVLIAASLGLGGCASEMDADPGLEEPASDVSSALPIGAVTAGANFAGIGVGTVAPVGTLGTVGAGTALGTVGAGTALGTVGAGTALGTVGAGTALGNVGTTTSFGGTLGTGPIGFSTTVGPIVTGRTLSMTAGTGMLPVVTAGCTGFGCL